MSRNDALERELVVWFVDSAAPRVPDYVDELVTRAVTSGQRPAASFPGRWLPPRLTERSAIAAPRALRTFGLIAILVVLVALAMAIAGSQRRSVPPPFGLASNGVVAYSSGGDIFTVDPVSGERITVATGPQTDVAPQFSLDGARLLFIRQTISGDVPIIVDQDGRNQVVADVPTGVHINGDSIAWSPDGRSIAFTSDLDGSIWLIDAVTGDSRQLSAVVMDGDIHWRPPDGRQLLFLGGTWLDRRLMLVTPETGAIEELPISAPDRSTLRPVGWTPDGRRYAYQLGGVAIRMWTYVVDIETGSGTVIAGAYCRLSNSGQRAVCMNGERRDLSKPAVHSDGAEEGTWLCVSRIEGGPCVRITPTHAEAWDTDYDWSPDDRWILTTPNGGLTQLLDPDGEPQAPPPWTRPGADFGGDDSWQRVAIEP